MFQKIWNVLWHLAHLIVEKIQKNVSIDTSKKQENIVSSHPSSIKPCQEIKDKDLNISLVVPRKFKYRAVDIYGHISYEGSEYEKAQERIRWLPSMMALYVLDENNNIVAALWSAPGTGILTSNLDTIIPN